MHFVSVAVDVNAVCSCDNYSALHIACIAGDTNIVSLLLEKGADIDKKDKRGALPIHKAAEYKHVEVANQLLENRFEY